MLIPTPDLATTEPRAGEMAGATDTGRISAVDRLVDEIRDMIGARRLAIGDPLPTERELGDMFAASRNTVREALQVLKAFGIVEARPKTGAVVSGGQAEAIRRLFSFHHGISPDTFRDVQGFRRLIETGIGDAVALTATEADFDRLDAINARMLDPGTVADLARRDFDFHEALVALAGNRTTLAIFRLMRPVIEDIMRTGKAARAVQVGTFEAHQGIIHALRTRDRIAFAYLVSQHLNQGLPYLDAADATKMRGKT